MEKRKEIRIAVIGFFAAMILVNFLGDLLPFNGLSTKDVSDMYQNLFTPAGITFSIWGFIYLLLLGYTLFQFGLIKNDNANPDLDNIISKINILFIISCALNSVWIFAWHYLNMWFALILIIGMLVTLILINMNFKNINFNTKEKIFIKLPFSIYFGWITVATIANVAALLVSKSWNGFGIGPSIWTMLILIVGAAIGIITSYKNENVAYIFVFVWAYIGILISHLGNSGYDNLYPEVISVLIGCLIAYSIYLSYMLFFRDRMKKI